MECISISYQSAPEEVRGLFVFSDEEKKKFLQKAKSSGEISQCVLLNTCNRTEVYLEGGEQAFFELEKLLADKAGENPEKIMPYYRRYQGKKTVEHLYRVACGLDSMVLGEDEILGQVRQAYLLASGEGNTGYELNTVFQGALSCAKKSKTVTDISKASVSIATLVSNEVFRYQQQNGKKPVTVLLIGGSGKMGSIILKNLAEHGGIRILATRRRHSVVRQGAKAAEFIDYAQRCKYLDEADVVVSATESPHYTLTAQQVRENTICTRERLFIDIAVPADLDREIKRLPKCRLISIDDFKRLAKENNVRRQQAISDTGELVEKELEAVYKTLAFHKVAGRLPEWKEKFKGYTFEKLLYYFRDELDAGSFEAILKLLEDSESD